MLVFFSCLAQLHISFASRLVFIFMLLCLLHPVDGQLHGSLEESFAKTTKKAFAYGRSDGLRRTEFSSFFLCVKWLGDNTALQKAFSSVTSTRLCDHAINVTLERDRAMATNKLQNTNDKHRRRAQYLHKFFSSLPLSFAASVCVTRFSLRTLFAEEDIDVLTAKTLDSRTSQHKHKVSTYIFCFSYLLYLF